MKTALWMILLAHLLAGMSHAQTFDNLEIRLGVYTSNNDGGERPMGMWRSTGPIVIGRTVASTFSFAKECEPFSVSTDGSLIDNVTAAWGIELLPIRVVGNAVSFRLRIKTAGLRGTTFTFSGFEHADRDVELTLRPEESMPALVLPRYIASRNCERPSSIRVSVEHYPGRESERRLVAADSWLIERLPDGTELPRSLVLPIRGVPNRPIDFYFDSVIDQNVALDIYGTLAARLESNGAAIVLETKCRWDRPANSRHIGPQRTVTSETRVGPSETVEVRLPAFGDDAGPYAKRTFSIRIRARQLR